MRTLWKFNLEVTDIQHVRMPKGAKVRKVGVQRGELCLWVEVDTEAEKEERTFEVIGTGNPMPTDMGIERTYIDSVQMERRGMEFVWHVYERVI